MTDLLIDRVDFELGQFLLVADGETLCALDFADYESRMITLLKKRYSTVRLVETANPNGFSDRLRSYLAGDLHSLDNIPVATGGTPFQQQVWLALRSIPSGTVTTYGELAVRLGNPKAVRAVGMANSQNPVAIALPCHRVVGANQRLTGYAGGLERKRWLLRHEGVAMEGFQ